MIPSACMHRPDSTAEQAAAKRLNILFILADDLGHGDLGAFGSEIPTPNLDGLAKHGLLLIDFYAGMSCAPTRAMLMSGLDHHQAGMGEGQSRYARGIQKASPATKATWTSAWPRSRNSRRMRVTPPMVGKWHLSE